MWYFLGDLLWDKHNSFCCIVCSNDLPCLNGGTCVDDSCYCPPGITGIRCERGNSLNMQRLLIYYHHYCLRFFLHNISWDKSCDTHISIVEEFPTPKPNYYCSPNIEMTSTDLDDAKQECQTDPLCKMFYRVCGYNRFRKCNDNAYEESASECTDIFGLSMLFKKGNIIMIWLCL